MMVPGVALIADYYRPVYRGGAEYSVEHLAEWLAQRVRVVVVTPDYRVGFPRGTVVPSPPVNGGQPEVRVRRYPIPDGCHWTGGYARFANVWWYVYSARWIRRICERENIGVLHCQGKHSLVGTWLAARGMLRPCVATLRDYQALSRYGVGDDDGRPVRRWTPAGLWWWMDAAIKRWVLRRYDRVVVLSEGMRQVYARAGIEAAVIANTVESPSDPRVGREYSSRGGKGGG